MPKGGDDERTAQRAPEVLGVKIVGGGLRQTATAWAGASLLVELYCPGPTQERPEGTRFAAFTIMGKLVSHAGSSLLRIATEMMVSLLAPGSRSRAVLGPG